MQSFSNTLQRTPFVSSHNSAGRRAPRRNVTVMAADHNSTDYPVVNQLQNILKSCVIGAAAAALALGPAVAPEALSPPAAEAKLVAKDPVKNANALLRIALPIDNKPIRQVQEELDGISEALRIPGSKSLGSVNQAVRKATAILNKEEAAIVGDFAPDKKEAGLKALEGLRAQLAEFSNIIAKEDKQAVPLQQQAALEYVNIIENAMVKGFPFEVPKQYDNLPQLKGRATVDMEIQFSSPRGENITSGKMRMVLDGYNAPISAGAFVDLVARNFYDGMDIQRADGFVVQTGKPSDGNTGFVDPKTGQLRTIPFEVKVVGDKEPVYEITLEELGRYNEQPVLPFNAYGTMAMARSEFEPNDASSQFFWLLKESELTPTGSNLLDGRYAVFGYITQGAELLKEMQVGDKIVKATVVDGLQFLQQPKN